MMDNNFDEVNIYNMELHEHVNINDKAFRGSILRVAGGWIYEHEARGYSQIQTVFVPYHNEFQETK
jgi:hypothetical protein